MRMLKGSTGLTFFSQTITVPVGTTGKKSFKIALPSEYNKVTGMGIHVRDISNQDNFKLSLVNASDELLPEMVNTLLLFNESVAPFAKLLPTYFGYKNNNEHTLVVNCVDGAVAGTDLVFELILKLEQNDMCSPVNRKSRDLETGSAAAEEIVDYGTNS